MELLKARCPECRSQDLYKQTVYTTEHHGRRVIYRCKGCGELFSQTRNTFLQGIRKPISLILRVLRERTEGMALNAICRASGVAKNTVIAWERRFSGIKQALLTYALVHQFLQMVIEGDELYTRVQCNTPADESHGWTIVLMDRASRFIWAMQCGRKDRKLFRKALATLCKLIERTRDLSLLTDGERRYGNVLFEICHELIGTGKKGRPRKTLKKGVKVRIKNKGSQAHKKGRKRAKYQAPCPEHPETVQDIPNSAIHANHTEGFNASLRRRNAAYRRRTNTYAKSDEALQRTLDMHWVIHNFVRPHFTTKKVPAVALGILESGLSWEEILMIPMAAA